MQIRFAVEPVLVVLAHAGLQQPFALVIADIGRWYARAPGDLANAPACLLFGDGDWGHGLTLK